MNVMINPAATMDFTPVYSVLFRHHPEQKTLTITAPGIVEEPMQYRCVMGQLGTVHVTDDPAVWGLEIAKIEFMERFATMIEETIPPQGDQADWWPAYQQTEENEDRVLDEETGCYTRTRDPIPEPPERITADTTNRAIVEVSPIFHGEAFEGQANRLAELPGLARDLAETCVLTGQGAPAMPHEVHSTRAWYAHTEGIARRLKIDRDLAERLHKAFETLQFQPDQFTIKYVTTPNGQKQIPTVLGWIMKSGPGKAADYFETLAAELRAVTDDDVPPLDLVNRDVENTIPHVDQPADEPAAPTAEKYHLLDDPRDDYKPWEERQPKEYQALLNRIRRTKTLDDLKVIGKQMFALPDAFSRTQTQVAWDEYKRQKARLTPKIRAKARRWMERITTADRKALAKAAGALHKNQEGFKPHELKAIWEAWKVRKAALAPKQTSLSLDPPQDDMPPVEAYQ